ncbi:unnamed protein product [Peniophora sp. CBMAI 1063]|nr:unnamed protein product [Peniophora sp. CBMAI 1063]
MKIFLRDNFHRTVTFEVPGKLSAHGDYSIGSLGILPCASLETLTIERAWKSMNDMWSIVPHASHLKRLKVTFSRMPADAFPWATIHFSALQHLYLSLAYPIHAASNLGFRSALQRMQSIRTFELHCDQSTPTPTEGPIVVQKHPCVSWRQLERMVVSTDFVTVAYLAGHIAAPAPATVLLNAVDSIVLDPELDSGLLPFLERHSGSSSRKLCIQDISLSGSNALLLWVSRDDAEYPDETGKSKEPAEFSTYLPIELSPALLSRLLSALNPGNIREVRIRLAADRAYTRPWLSCINILPNVTHIRFTAVEFSIRTIWSACSLSAIALRQLLLPTTSSGEGILPAFRQLAELDLTNTPTTAFAGRCLKLGPTFRSNGLPPTFADVLLGILKSRRESGFPIGKVQICRYLDLLSGFEEEVLCSLLESTEVNCLYPLESWFSTTILQRNHRHIDTTHS